MDAASCGDAKELRRLLASGVDQNSADEDGTSALMAAAFAGELTAVRVLLENGADPDLQDESGLTALMNAVIAEGEMDLDGARPVFLSIVGRLLDVGADVELVDENGLTASDYAMSYGLLDMVELLSDSR